jgi:hypothetical protein
MQDLAELQRGDIVRNTGSGDSYVVIQPAVGEQPPIAIRHVTLTNRWEWDLFSRSERVTDANARR